MSNLPAPGVYTIDVVHSTAGFVARHAVVAKVRGHFTDFAGELVIGDSLENSSVKATAQVTSVTTGNEMRDNHLRSADFFEHETYPTIDFASTAIRAKGGEDYEMVADLTIHGITKSVVFDLEYLGTGPGPRPGTTVVGFEANTEVNRRDFNVNFEGVIENGNLAVSNKIAIELTVEAFKQD